MERRTCSYLLPHKRRFCRLQTIEGSTFCVHHANSAELTSNNRIFCPCNSKHTIQAHHLGKHLRVCPDNRTHPQSSLHPVNSVSDVAFPACKTLPPIQTIREEVLLFINKLRFLDLKLGLTKCVKTTPTPSFEPIVSIAVRDARHWSVNGPSGLHHHSVTERPDDKSSDAAEKIDFTDDVSPPQSRGSQRHIYQSGCLISLLKAAGLLSAAYNFVEFGAGRGGLSYWINLCLTFGGNDLAISNHLEPSWPAERVSTRYLLIDQKKPRYRLDARHKRDGAFVRLHMNIAYLDLMTVPFVQDERKPIVAVAKHLCGTATDLALRCLRNAYTANPHSLDLAGVLFALCCHHQCTWEECVGRRWLERDAGLNAREFAIATRLTSWATCGFQRRLSKEEAMPDSSHHQRDRFTDAAELIQHKDEAESSSFDEFTVSEQINLGRLAKVLIDWSRLCYLREELNFPATALHIYTSSNVTAENVALCASRLVVE